MKAIYKGRYQIGDDIFLRYEYRGREYEVRENRVKGNEPLGWQHKSEQILIDRILDTPTNDNSRPAQEGIDAFFSYYE